MNNQDSMSIEDFKVLVVEDDPIILAGIKDFLSLKNLKQVCTASNGKEAIQIAHEFVPHVAIVDVNLGTQPDGTEVAKHLSAELNSSIIYLTAYSDLDFFEKVKIQGPCTYISKPFRDSDVWFNLMLAHERWQNREKVYSTDSSRFLFELGKLIRNKRKFLKLSQKDAAEKLEINYRHYQDIERGKVNLKTATLFHLLSFYKISVDQLKVVD